jgi:hypothetical protein
VPTPRDAQLTMQDLKSFRGNRIQWDFLIRQTAASGCKGFPTFRELTPSPSSGCAGGLVLVLPMYQKTLHILTRLSAPRILNWSHNVLNSRIQDRTFLPTKYRNPPSAISYCNTHWLHHATCAAMRYDSTLEVCQVASRPRNDYYDKR